MITQTAWIQTRRRITRRLIWIQAAWLPAKCPTRCEENRTIFKMKQTTYLTDDNFHSKLRVKQQHLCISLQCTNYLHRRFNRFRTILVANKCSVQICSTLFEATWCYIQIIKRWAFSVEPVQNYHKPRGVFYQTLKFDRWTGLYALLPENSRSITNRIVSCSYSGWVSFEIAAMRHNKVNFQFKIISFHRAMLLLRQWLV